MSDLEIKKNDNDEIDIGAIFKVLWKKKVFIILVTLGFGILGLGLSFVLPRTYDATVTVLPVTSGSSSSALSQLSGLASMAGVDVSGLSGGSSSPGKTVNALLSSRLLVERVVKDLDLVNKLHLKVPKDKDPFRITVENLQKRIKSKEDLKTGVITITVDDKDPLLAQSIANKVAEVLDDLLVEKAMTTSQKQSDSLERQIEAQSAKVTAMQTAMAKFQKRTDLLDPKTQAGQAFGALTQLIQKKMELEIEYGSAQSTYAPGNSKLETLKQELDAINTQIQQVKNQTGGGDLPSLKRAPEDLITYQNLYRDLEIATKLYSVLLASLEQNKLQADKDKVYIEVLDKALLPEQAKPSKIIVVGIVVLLGFFISILYIFLRKKW